MGWGGVGRGGVGWPAAKSAASATVRKVDAKRGVKRATRRVKFSLNIFSGVGWGGVGWKAVWPLWGVVGWGGEAVWPLWGVGMGWVGLGWAGLGKGEKEGE